MACSASVQHLPTSAKLAGMETAARRICCDNPYVACLGKPEVNASTANKLVCFVKDLYNPIHYLSERRLPLLNENKRDAHLL